MTGITVHVSLMHAPWSNRWRYVRAAAAACEHPSIVGFRVVNDTLREGVWPTARRAWEVGAISAASHVLVLQDDVHLCHAFPDNISAVVAARPAHILSLFSMGRGDVLKAKERGVSWAWGPDAAYGQALLMPRDEVRRFLAWEVDHVRPDYPHDDNRVAMYARCTGQGIWVPCPNLVNHGEPGASLLGHSNRHRVARWYDPTPAHVDWSLGLDAPVRLSPTVDPRPILRDPSLARRPPRPTKVTR